MVTETHTTDPKVASNHLNQLKRKSISPEGRQRIRETILRTRPWETTPGPKTAEGKARSAQNGKWRQKGLLSRRELERELAETDLVLTGLAATRHRIGKQATEPE